MMPVPLKLDANWNVHACLEPCTDISKALIASFTYGFQVSCLKQALAPFGLSDNRPAGR
jgi:hypothetical protein